jgi:uncharacterized protein (DUF983 family)
MTTDRGRHCQACGSGRTYWTFTSVDGDAWDCGSCGHQWVVEVVEMITERSSDGLGDHTREVG